MNPGLLNSAYISALVAFAVLAKYGKMAEAVRILGVSRQTISRHMDLLDEKLGGPVIVASGRDHEVTPRGRVILGSAEALLEQVKALTINDGLISLIADGLQSVWLTSDQSEFRGQQHPLWRVYKDSPEPLQRAFDAWKRSNGDATAPDIEAMHPYILMFRRTPNGWICTHVGVESAYAKWFGWEWAKSAIGSFTSDAISGSDYSRFAAVGYMDVLKSGSCRLDHHDIKRGTKGHGMFQDIKYHRLSMGLRLPNNEPILATYVHLADTVDVAENIFSAEHKFKLNRP